MSIALERSATRRALLRAQAEATPGLSLGVVPYLYGPPTAPLPALPSYRSPPQASEEWYDDDGFLYEADFGSGRSRSGIGAPHLNFTGPAADTLTHPALRSTVRAPAPSPVLVSPPQDVRGLGFFELSPHNQRVYVPPPQFALPRRTDPDTMVTLESERSHRAGRRAPPIAYFNRDLFVEPSVSQSAVHLERAYYAPPPQPYNYSYERPSTAVPASSRARADSLAAASAHVSTNIWRERRQQAMREYDAHRATVISRRSQQSYPTPPSTSTNTTPNSNSTLKSVFEDWTDSEDEEETTGQKIRRRAQSFGAALRRFGGLNGRRR